MGKELHALDGHGDDEYVRAIQEFGESIPYRLQSTGQLRIHRLDLFLYTFEYPDSTFIWSWPPRVFLVRS